MGHLRPYADTDITESTDPVAFTLVLPYSGGRAVLTAGQHHQIAVAKAG